MAMYLDCGHTSLPIYDPKTGERWESKEQALRASSSGYSAIVITCDECDAVTEIPIPKRILRWGN